MAEDKNAQLDIEEAIAIEKLKSGEAESVVVGENIIMMPPLIVIDKKNAWYYATILDSLKLSMIVDQTHEMAVLGHIIRVLRGEADTLVIRENNDD